MAQRKAGMLPRAQENGQSPDEAGWSVPLVFQRCVCKAKTIIERRLVFLCSNRVAALVDIVHCLPVSRIGIDIRNVTDIN